MVGLGSPRKSSPPPKKNQKNSAFWVISGKFTQDVWEFFGLFSCFAGEFFSNFRELVFLTVGKRAFQKSIIDRGPGPNPFPICHMKGCSNLSNPIAPGPMCS